MQSRIEQGRQRLRRLFDKIHQPTGGRRAGQTISVHVCSLPDTATASQALGGPVKLNRFNDVQTIVRRIRLTRVRHARFSFAGFNRSVPLWFPYCNGLPVIRFLDKNIVRTRTSAFVRYLNHRARHESGCQFLTFRVGTRVLLENENIVKLPTLKGMF